MPPTRYCGRCLSTFETDPGVCPNLACGSLRPVEAWGIVLDSGDVLDRRYRVERCLAVGGAGLTYLARELDERGEPFGPRVAIKVLYNARASGPFLRRLSTEAQILQELAHENIVELRGFVHRSGHEPYLVTRFEEGGSLTQHLDRVGTPPATVAAAILRQVLLGLDVAHQRGVVHRDLKPDNVLLAAETARDRVPHIRVADFGIAKIAGGIVGERLTRSGAFVGTPEYAAPEQFLGQTPTPATDVFAAGLLFVYLLTSKGPFKFSHRADIQTSHAEMLAQFPVRLPPIPGIDAATTARIQDVIEHVLVVDPSRRWTIHQILASLGPLVEAAGPRWPTIETTGTPAPVRTEPQTLPLTEYPRSAGLAVTLGSDGGTPPAPPVRSFDEAAVPKPMAGLAAAEALQAPTAPVPSDAPPAPPSTLDGVEPPAPAPPAPPSTTLDGVERVIAPRGMPAVDATPGLFGDAPPAPPPTLDGVMIVPPLGDLDPADLPTAEATPLPPSSSVDDGLPMPLEDDPSEPDTPNDGVTTFSPIGIPGITLSDTAPQALDAPPPPPAMGAAPPPSDEPPPPPTEEAPPPTSERDDVAPPTWEEERPQPPAADVVPPPPPPVEGMVVAEATLSPPPLPSLEPPPPLAPVIVAAAAIGVAHLPSSETLLPMGVAEHTDEAAAEAPPASADAPPAPVAAPQTPVVAPPVVPPTTQKPPTTPAPPRLGSAPPPPPPFGEPIAADGPLVAPVTSATPTPAASGGSRAAGAAGIAGCFGLSMFGVGAVGAGGLLVVVVLLVGFAAATGWLWEGGRRPDPVVVDDQDPPRFRDAPPLPELDQRKVLRIVREAKRDLAARCGDGAAVNAQVLADTSGRLVYAKIDPGGLGTVDPACLKRGLERLKVRGGLRSEGIATITFAL